MFDKKKYYKEYYKKNKDKYKENNKKYYKENKERLSKRIKKYDKRKRRLYLERNRQEENHRSREEHRKIRRLILDHYGPFCACCGEKEERFLTIDHINNNGNKHRKELGGNSQVSYWLVRNNFPDGEYAVQILCFNCNVAKRFSGVCPHQQIKD